MEDYGNERKQASLSSEDQKAINNRDKINSWNGLNKNIIIYLIQ